MSEKRKNAENQVIPFPKTGASKLRKPASLYQFKITLKGSRPPIWRRILVPSDITFYRLHQIIQTVFNWQDCHLFEFSFRDMDVSIPQDDDFPALNSRPSKNAMHLKLNRLFPAEQRCVYTYDFGDNWQHSVVLEKVLEAEPGAFYPVCTAGKKHAPPEDIGGIGGYYDFLEALRDPQNPQHGDMLEWIGGSEEDPGFDPELCDLDEINGMLEDL